MAVSSSEQCDVQTDNSNNLRQLPSKSHEINNECIVEPYWCGNPAIEIIQGVIHYYTLEATEKILTELTNQTLVSHDPVTYLNISHVTASINDNKIYLNSIDNDSCQDEKKDIVVHKQDSTCQTVFTPTQDCNDTIVSENMSTFSLNNNNNNNTFKLLSSNNNVLHSNHDNDIIVFVITQVPNHLSPAELFEFIVYRYGLTVCLNNGPGVDLIKVLHSPSPLGYFCLIFCYQWSAYNLFRSVNGKTYNPLESAECQLYLVKGITAEILSNKKEISTNSQIIYPQHTTPTHTLSNHLSPSTNSYNHYKTRHSVTLTPELSTFEKISNFKKCSSLPFNKPDDQNVSHLFDISPHTVSHESVHLERFASIVTELSIESHIPDDVSDSFVMASQLPHDTLSPPCPDRCKRCGCLSEHIIIPSQRFLNKTVLHPSIHDIENKHGCLCSCHIQPSYHHKLSQSRSMPDDLLDHVYQRRIEFLGSSDHIFFPYYEDQDIIHDENPLCDNPFPSVIKTLNDDPSIISHPVVECDILDNHSLLPYSNKPRSLNKFYQPPLIDSSSYSEHYYRHSTSMNPSETDVGSCIDYLLSPSILVDRYEGPICCAVCLEKVNWNSGTVGKDLTSTSLNPYNSPISPIGHYNEAHDKLNVPTHTIEIPINILCGHTFHAHCLLRWADSTCPYCRYQQYPSQLTSCDICGTTDHIQMCLICGFFGCITHSIPLGKPTKRDDVHNHFNPKLLYHPTRQECPTQDYINNSLARQSNVECVLLSQDNDSTKSVNSYTAPSSIHFMGHAFQHFLDSQHIYALEISSQRVWDFSRRTYVHRLLQNRTDGKVIEIEPTNGYHHYRHPQQHHHLSSKSSSRLEKDTTYQTDCNDISLLELNKTVCHHPETHTNIFWSTNNLLHVPNRHQQYNKNYYDLDSNTLEEDHIIYQFNVLLRTELDHQRDDFEKQAQTLETTFLELQTELMERLNRSTTAYNQSQRNLEDANTSLQKEKNKREQLVKEQNNLLLQIEKLDMVHQRLNEKVKNIEEQTRQEEQHILEEIHSKQQFIGHLKSQIVDLKFHLDANKKLVIGGQIQPTSIVIATKNKNDRRRQLNSKRHH